MSAFSSHAYERPAYGRGDLSRVRLSFGQTAFPGAGLTPRAALIKRLTDIILALATLIATAALMALIAAAITLTSDGPALFRQERIGLNGRRFVMLKFRTMHHTAQCTTGFLQTTRHDPRVTRVGALLRHTSLDELPQLLNVLEGTMSLVGPRPHAPGTCAAGRPFEAVADHYGVRHCVKPGMTGLAQIRGWRGETDTVDKLLGRIDSDLEYIATWTLRRDFVILWHTIRAMLRMTNAY
jgi:lipopolysaccharide/colanic/teichoic acid biosynthesis glycosyltransferase